MDTRLMVLPIVLSLGISASFARAESPAPSSPEGAKDLCSYLKDVQAKTDEACSTEGLAVLKAQDQAAFAAALVSAQKRKSEVLAAYDFLKALPPVNGSAGAKPAPKQPEAAAAPDPMRLQPPINDRTFPAWIGADAPDFKAVYARWLDAKNAELKHEQQGPVTEKRNAQISAELASNQAKLSRLDKIKDPSELSCYLGDTCGARGGVSGLGGGSVAAGRKWTADDYKRANAQARADVQAPGGALDRGIPSEAAAAAIGNSPLGPLANPPASDSSSPLRTTAELALAATGGLLLFGGLGGQQLEEKLPGIRRVMGITALVSGTAALAVIARPRLLAAALPFANPQVEEEASEDLPSGHAFIEKVAQSASNVTPQASAGVQRTEQQMVEEVSTLRTVGRAGSSPRIRLIEGTVEDAQAMFQRLSRFGKRLSGTTYRGQLIELPNGSRIGLRLVSKSGPPTIDIHSFPGFPENLEIKFLK